MVCGCLRVDPGSIRQIIIRVTVVRITFHPVIRGNNSITAGSDLRCRERRHSNRYLLRTFTQLNKKTKKTSFQTTVIVRDRRDSGGMGNFASGTVKLQDISYK